MKRLVIVCPGRGSYTEASLGSLPKDDERVLAAEDLRASNDLPPLLELDGAARFSAALHLRPGNAAPLIYLISMLDAARALEGGRGRAVCVTGNSMGWYTALAVAGALSFEDGFRLVQEMALLQEDGTPGGQVIYPRVDANWQPAPELERHAERALGALPGEVFSSIELGGYVVLAGSRRGVKHLLGALPRVQLGKTTYPFQLAQHGPYHTPLARDVSDAAHTRLATLDFRAPKLPLVDGMGRRWSPWSADLKAMRAYTLGAQVTEPYDLTTAVRVALREYAPERLVLPGPGNTLGGVCGQILVRERWRGITSRAAFDDVQAGDTPVLESMRR